MIKGINRQMIEVTHTESPYFERAFLVVRPQAGEPSPDTLECIARRIVQQADSYAGMRHQWRRIRLRHALLCGIGAAVGAAVMWLVTQWI